MTFSCFLNHPPFVVKKKKCNIMKVIKALFSVLFGGKK